MAVALFGSPLFFLLLIQNEHAVEESDKYTSMWGTEFIRRIKNYLRLWSGGRRYMNCLAKLLIRI